MLRRIGNKSKIAHKIHTLFPTHKVYYEPFFGGGGMFFNKPQSQYSIVNDNDSDVFNLFLVVKDRLDELLFLFKATPMSEEVFYYFLNNKENDPVKKAIRFLFLSSFSYLGKNDTFQLIHSNCTFKQKLERLIINTSNLLNNVTIRNKDFRDFFNDIYVTEKHIPERHRFIYADPPYLKTTNNYKNGFTEQDVVDLFDTLMNTGIKFAYSEFDNPFILDQAAKRKLTVTQIGNRRTIGSRNNEILITNYNPLRQTLF